MNSDDDVRQKTGSTHGMPEPQPGTEATREDYPESTARDARRAVVDAARYDGMTCARGGFEARRTVLEPEPHARPGDTVSAIVLSARAPGDEALSWYRATPIGDLRDDWGHPTPCEPGETVLPEAEYAVEALFPDVSVLPGRSP